MRFCDFLLCSQLLESCASSDLVYFRPSVKENRVEHHTIKDFRRYLINVVHTTRLHQGVYGTRKALCLLMRRLQWALRHHVPWSHRNATGWNHRFHSSRLLGKTSIVFLPYFQGLVCVFCQHHLTNLCICWEEFLSPSNRLCYAGDQDRESIHPAYRLLPYLEHCLLVQHIWRHILHQLHNVSFAFIRRSRPLQFPMERFLEVLQNIVHTPMDWGIPGMQLQSFLSHDILLGLLRVGAQILL